MFARLYSSINKCLYGVSKSNLMIILRAQGIDGSSIESDKLDELIEIETELATNDIRQLCANIGIVLILLLFVYEIFLEVESSVLFCY